jgi:hypothetical protein
MSVYIKQVNIRQVNFSNSSVTLTPIFVIIFLQN